LPATNTPNCILLQPWPQHVLLPLLHHPVESATTGWERMKGRRKRVRKKVRRSSS
jgi:hypothetical protein